MTTIHQRPSSLATSLVGWCETIAGRIDLPAVDHVYLPPPQLAGEKSRKFGLVVLEDHSTGFFFTRWDPSAPRRPPSAERPGDALELARWFLHPDLERRAIGLGAIGAITQTLFRRAGYHPPEAENPLADFDFGNDDHVGMVGYFSGLVGKLRARGIRLTVLELDERYLEAADRFEVTLDPARLTA